jgi:adenine-specific DNA-methyltransferase
VLNYARNLRQNLTDAECLLWSRLRRRQLAGFKFRRQHMIGPYICDFVCSEGALVVELDGSQHLDAAAYDARRGDFLRSKGFRVLRFWSGHVLGETESVIETIVEALHRREMDGRFD